MKVREGYYSEKNRNEAYVGLLDSLSKMQMQVYNIIKDYGPVSNEEIAKILKLYPNNITPRVYELRKLGLVEYSGESKAVSSNRSVSLWKIVPLNNQLQLFG